MNGNVETITIQSSGIWKAFLVKLCLMARLKKKMFLSEDMISLGRFHSLNALSSSIPDLFHAKRVPVQKENDLIRTLSPKFLNKKTLC